jgi:hypothetical protein
MNEHVITRICLSVEYRSVISRGLQVNKYAVFERIQVMCLFKRVVTVYVLRQPGICSGILLQNTCR